MILAVTFVKDIYFLGTEILTQVCDIFLVHSGAIVGLISGQMLMLIIKVFVVRMSYMC